MAEHAMNRRGFLRLAGLGAVAAAVPGAVASALTPESEVHQWIRDMCEYPGQPEDDCGRRYFDMGAHPDRIALQMRDQALRAIIKDNLLQRTFHDALFPRLLYRQTVPPRVENGIIRLEAEVVHPAGGSIVFATEIQEGPRG